MPLHMTRSLKVMALTNTSWDDLLSPESCSLPLPLCNMKNQPYTDHRNIHEGSYNGLTTRPVIANTTWIDSRVLHKRQDQKSFRHFSQKSVQLVGWVQFWAVPLSQLCPPTPLASNQPNPVLGETWLDSSMPLVLCSSPPCHVYLSLPLDTCSSLFPSPQMGRE